MIEQFAHVFAPRETLTDAEVLAASRAANEELSSARENALDLLSIARDNLGNIDTGRLIDRLIEILGGTK